MNLESIQKGVVEAVKFYVLHVVAPEGSSPFPDRRIVPVRLRWYDLYFSTGYEVIIEISSSKKETYGFAPRYLIPPSFCQMESQLSDTSLYPTVPSPTCFGQQYCSVLVKEECLDYLVT